MRKITKAIAISAFVAAIAGVGITAMAQTAVPGTGFMRGHMAQGMMGMGQGMGQGMMGMGNGSQRAGFGDPAAHLAALKTELGITPAQANAWDAYTKAVQDATGQMRATMAKVDMKTIHNMSPQDRTAFMTSQREQHVQTFAKVKTAAEALLPTLDDAQKAKAQTVLPGLTTGGPGGMAGMGGMGMMQGRMGGATR